MGDKNPADKIGIEMGRRIRAARLGHEWTQEDLAKATGWRQADADNGRANGLSPSRIANYEQGTRRLDNEEADILSRIFGLPSAYFLAAIDAHEAQVLQAMRAPKASQNRSPTLARSES